MEHQGQAAVRGRRYGAGYKLTREQASEIKRLYYSTQTSLRKLGRQFGVSHQMIFYIVNAVWWVDLRTERDRLNAEWEAYEEYGFIGG